MKLVDILARELKVWPEGVESLSQLKGTGYIISGKGFDSRAFDALEIADETRIAGVIVTRDEWQAAVDALDIPKFPSDKVEWNGDGLPPIGMHVVVHDDGSLVYGRGESGEVIAHVDGCAVIRMSYGLGCFMPRCLRTPEQIATEERENELNRMVATVSMLDKGWARKVCAGLYDAGYRKQGAE